MDDLDTSMPEEEPGSKYKVLIIGRRKILQKLN